MLCRSTAHVCTWVSLYFRATLEAQMTRPGIIMMCQTASRHDNDEHHHHHTSFITDLSDRPLHTMDSGLKRMTMMIPDRGKTYPIMPKGSWVLVSSSSLPFHIRHEPDFH
ncbi:hypothetical protein V8F06_000570 [Rhypophila decipiens]